MTIAFTQNIKDGLDCLTVDDAIVYLLEQKKKFIQEFHVYPSSVAIEVYDKSIILRGRVEE